MKLKWIYWASTGLLAAIYLGGGTLYLSNISGVTSRNNCDSILEIDATGRPLADKAREVTTEAFKPSSACGNADEESFRLFSAAQFGRRL